MANFLLHSVPPALPGMSGGEENRGSAHKLPYRCIAGLIEPVWGLKLSFTDVPKQHQGGCDLSSCCIFIIHVFGGDSSHLSLVSRPVKKLFLHVQHVFSYYNLRTVHIIL